MISKRKYILKASFVFLSILFAGYAKAQCPIIVSGKYCVGSPIQFEGSLTGSNHNWDFNGEGSNNLDAKPIFTFATAGSKKITYSVTLPDGTKCNSEVTIDVKALPTSSLKIITLDTQCFENNLFCYKDSSFNTNGASLDSIIYIINDGQQFVFSKPTMPKTFCFSVINPLGGNFTVTQFIKDANGCETSIDLVNDINVRPRIGPSFISNKPVACDSVQAIVTNTSQIDRSTVKKVTWIWGDGTTETGWGPNKTHWYIGQGTYDGKLIIETNNGCTDSFTLKATATVFTSDVRILANRDSVCISDPEIKFSVSQIPSGATGFLWNFGNPPSGPANFNFRTWSPSHQAWGLGPYQISLTYQHPVCGNRTVYDTIQVIGPVSTIEVAFDRIEEYQTFQCPAYKLERVQMKNFSTFYHNDTQFLDDDSSYMKDGDLKHSFDGAQITIPYQLTGPNIRQISDCIWRVWDFGDTYAPQCTTYTRFNQNTGINCNYNSDSLPSHLYKSWDQIMLTDFKLAPMQDAIFIDSNRLCKRILIWPSDSSYIIEDTFVTVPFSTADTSKASAAPYANILTKHNLLEKGFKGPGTRFVVQQVEIDIPAGTDVWIGDEDGNNRVKHSGAKKLMVEEDQTVWLNTSTDTITWLFTSFVKTDTLPLPMLALRNANGEFPKIIDIIVNTRPGIRGFDYDVNWKRWVDLYYARIPSCNNIQLSQQDTCHKLQCKSVAVKQVTMMHANAGGTGSGLLKQSIECLGAINPQYGITFLLNDLKPGCTFSDVQLNFDTFCGPNNWVPLGGLSPGNRPPGPPYMGYQMQGNPPSRYSKSFAAADVCSPNQCITVGVIVGNGVAKDGTKPLCADTQYYEDFACFPLIDPSFEVIEPSIPPGQFMKICRNDPVIVRNLPGNLTNVEDLKTLRWEMSTSNASPYYSKTYSFLIDETYYRYKKLSSANGVAYDTNKLYNYLTTRRGSRSPTQTPCTNEWEEGSSYVFSDIDTIVTAEILAWDTFADVSKVWQNIKDRAEANGFDPFSLTGQQIARMIWNNVGQIGQPNTGARGCLDTSGFGKDIIFKIIPRGDTSKVIMHYRDTSVKPLDSAFHPTEKKMVNAYTFRPPWSGYYALTLAMTDQSGNCDDIRGVPFVAGFGMMLEFDDSIVCQAQANSLVAKPDFRMFHADPQNFGTWDPVRYWNDPQRQIDVALGVANREALTRWDWNKDDDDLSDPRTIFGTDPWASTGVGNPFKQLGSTLYYKNDSGVYTWRVIAGDSTGCLDTIEKRLFVTRLDLDFTLGLDLINCKSVVSFQDSTILHDPCGWALKNCSGGSKVSCDFINRWRIDWGDGSRETYIDRPNRKDLRLSDLNVAHSYNQRGWFTVTYIVRTDQGCTDTFTKQLFIPGPRPKFEYKLFAGNEATICVGETVEFNNLTDSFTNTSTWNWFFGDNNFKTTKNDSDVIHQYNTPGRFFVTLQQLDSVSIPPVSFGVCPVTFPDTPNVAGFYVNVKKRDTFDADVLKPIICPSDSNTIFISLNDTAFKSYSFEVYPPGDTMPSETVVRQDSFYTRVFNERGQWTVVVDAEYDPAAAKPWCNSGPVTITFFVDTITADFDIDSTNKPEFCFLNTTDPDGTKYQWGYYHSSDITITKDDFIISGETDNKDKVCVKYDTVGQYWVCLIAENSNGCKDTVCKVVVNDYFKQLLIANVFTPGNNDGKNDVFRFPIKGNDQFEVNIFNRWNERVFHTEDPDVHWNGQVNNTGAEVPDGTYFYVLTVKFLNEDEAKVISGSVNVIRD